MNIATKTTPPVATSAGMRIEDQANGVRIVIFDRPTRRNSIDAEFLTRLARELDAIAADPDVRVVILTGANGIFSAGADFQDLDNMFAMTEAEVDELLSHEMLVAQQIWELPQPTIAAINGPAVGAAMSLALACDIRIGSPSMALLPSFIRMGLVPDTGMSWLLPHLIGQGPALEVVLSGRPINAEQARRLGLVSQVTDDALASALELAATFAARPPAAVRTTKRLLRDAAQGDLARAIKIEARIQAASIHGAEFSAAFAGWRTSRVAD